jgi:hypothetical protein
MEQMIMNKELADILSQTPLYGTENEGHEGDVYLGRYSGEYRIIGEISHYDLWYCPQDLCGPTIVARWSSYGPDYGSGMVFGWILDKKSPGHPLVIARKRAQALGLDVNEHEFAELPKTK